MPSFEQRKKALKKLQKGIAKKIHDLGDAFKASTGGIHQALQNGEDIYQFLWAGNRLSAAEMMIHSLLFSSLKYAKTIRPKYHDRLNACIADLDIEEAALILFENYVEFFGEIQHAQEIVAILKAAAIDEADYYVEEDGNIGIDLPNWVTKDDIDKAFSGSPFSLPSSATLH